MKAKLHNHANEDFPFMYGGESYVLPKGGFIEVAEESTAHWVIKKLCDEGKVVMTNDPKKCVLQVEVIPPEPEKPAPPAIVVPEPEPKKKGK